MSILISTKGHLFINIVQEVTFCVVFISRDVLDEILD